MRLTVGLIGSLRRLRNHLAVKDRRRFVGLNATSRLSWRTAKDFFSSEGAKFGQRCLIGSLDSHRMRKVDPNSLSRDWIVRINAVLAYRSRGKNAVTRTARLDDRLLEQAARHW